MLCMSACRYIHAVVHGERAPPPCHCPSQLGSSSRDCIDDPDRRQNVSQRSCVWLIEHATLCIALGRTSSLVACFYMIFSSAYFVSPQGPIVCRVGAVLVEVVDLDLHDIEVGLVYIQVFFFKKNRRVMT